MKSIKMVAVGAVAAALILGTGCSQRHDDSVRHDLQATGGSGMAPINDTAPSSAMVPVSPPVNDSLRGMQDQDAIGHQDSLAKDSIEQDALKQGDLQKDSVLNRDSSTMHSSISTKKHTHLLDDSMDSSSPQKQGGLSADIPSDLGVGGAGNTIPTPIEDTPPLPVPDNSAIATPPAPMDRSADTLGSSYTGVPNDTMNRTLYQNHRRLNGSLDNETGSRTNTTGSNISTNTNPTEPRSAAKDQVPRR